MGQVAHTFQVIEGGSFDVLPELSKEPTKEPQRNLEKWLPSEVVVSLAGVSDRMVGKALTTCTWRGCALLVREEQTGRGRGGKTLQVHVDSLPADLREAWYLERGIVLHAKPDTQTGHTLLVPEQAYQNDAKFEADLELARWRHDVIRPLLLLDRQSAERAALIGELIHVALGFEGRPLLPMGTFILDEITYEIAPDRMILSAKAAQFGGTLKDQKTRNWDGHTNEQIVRTIAEDHQLTPKIADHLKRIKHEYLAQRAESDINFLNRIGQDQDAIVSMKELPDKGHALLFLGKGEGKTTSGATLPQTSVYKSKLMPGSRVTKNKATLYKSVKAIWPDKKVGEKKAVTAGEGAPTFEITHPYRSESSAKRAAHAKLDEEARTGHSVSLNLIGNPALRAEEQLRVIGLRPNIPSTWSITNVTHRLNAGGYTTQIQGELPKSEVQDSQGTV